MGARDLQAEREHAEFTGWAEAQGYPPDTGERPEYAYDDLEDAFKAGMQAQCDLCALGDCLAVALAALTRIAAARGSVVDTAALWDIAGDALRVIGEAGD
jgi:hypothetical protein